jgi:hypothetical protein
MKSTYVKPTYSFAVCPICEAAILPVAAAQGGASVLEYECGTRLKLTLDVLAMCFEMKS